MGRKLCWSWLCPFIPSHVLCFHKDPDHENNLNSALDRRKTDLIHRLAIMENRLSGVNPDLPLQRGYAMVFDKERKLIRSAVQAENAAEMTLRFNDGEVKVSPR